MRTLTPLAAALALLAAACAPVAGPDQPQQTPTAAACQAQGGTLQPVGRMQTLQCVIDYADAGKPCTDGDQCAGDCRADTAEHLDAGAPAAGRCQADSNRFGCYTTVENGKAEATICVD